MIALRAKPPVRTARSAIPCTGYPNDRLFGAAPRHAGEGRYLRLLFVAARKAVDTGLRRHDDVCGAGGSILRRPGITAPPHRMTGASHDRASHDRASHDRAMHYRTDRIGAHGIGVDTTRADSTVGHDRAGVPLVE